VSDSARDDERGSMELQRRTAPPSPAASVGGWASLAKRVGGGAKHGLSNLAERLIDIAPRIPVRDLDTLRKQFPGLGAEEIADKLIRAATTATAAVGAGVGAAAALPVPPAMAAELTAETLAVAAVEYKLIAELHEVYGRRAEGNTRQRVTAYLSAWARQRGIRVSRPGSVDAALSGQLKRELRQRLVRRSTRNLPTLTPFMIGATIGAILNRRDTTKLAERVRSDLRGRQQPWDAISPRP
jgi:hypothetical protein